MRHCLDCTRRDLSNASVVRCCGCSMRRRKVMVWHGCWAMRRYRWYGREYSGLRMKRSWRRQKFGSGCWPGHTRELDRRILLRVSCPRHLFLLCFPFLYFHCQVLWFHAIRPGAVCTPVWRRNMASLRAARNVAALIVVLIYGETAIGQAEKKLEFDVASVRQNKSNEKQRSNFAMDNGYVFSTVSKTDTYIPAGGLFSASNMSLTAYISFAYKLSATQWLALRAWQIQFDGFVGSSTSLPKWVT